jgi:hypothetical protein
MKTPWCGRHETFENRSIHDAKIAALGFAAFEYIEILQKGPEVSQNG